MKILMSKNSYSSLRISDMCKFRHIGSRSYETWSQCLIHVFMSHEMNYTSMTPCDIKLMSHLCVHAT